VAELAPEALAQARYAEFRRPSWTGPVLAYGEWPKDHAEQQRMLAANLGGVDLQHLPRYYAPYEQGRADILRRALPIAQARTREPAAAKAIDEWLPGSGYAEDRLRYVALRGRNFWVAVLIDRDTARPVKMLLAEPV
jgi:hypothetical protein